MNEQTLLDLALTSTKPTHTDDWIRWELDEPPTDDRGSWASVLPTDLIAIWNDLSPEARIVAFWVAYRFREHQ